MQFMAKYLCVSCLPDGIAFSFSSHVLASPLISFHFISSPVLPLHSPPCPSPPLPSTSLPCPLLRSAVALQDGHPVLRDSHEHVVILFSDIVGFGTTASTMSAIVVFLMHYILTCRTVTRSLETPTSMWSSCSVTLWASAPWPPPCQQWRSSSCSPTSTMPSTAWWTSSASTRWRPLEMATCSLQANPPELTSELPHLNSESTYDAASERPDLTP